MAAPAGLVMILLPSPWKPDPAIFAKLKAASPGIEVDYRIIGMYQEELPRDISEEQWKQVTVLLTWHILPTKEQAPNLKYVQLISAGCNHLPGQRLFDETTDVTFCTANGIHPPQITEWVFSCFLSFQHHLPEHLENQKLCKWVSAEHDEDTEDAVGLRVGILGYGCIGRQTARVAKSFGMDVYAYTSRERATPESRRDDSFTEPGLGDPEGEFPSRWFHGDDQLNDFLAADLDLLVITLPLTDKTRKMISTKQFELMGRKRTYVCNAGRGAIVDTAAIIDALDRGLIRGAALDVTDPEPLPSDHPLWRAKNVIITPHCSGNSSRYYERALRILAYNLERRAKGLPMVNQVDKKRGY